MPTNDKSRGCCPEPPCPSVSLLCNSISASKSKCGFLGFNISPDVAGFYLKRTTTVSNSSSGGFSASCTSDIGESFSHSDSCSAGESTVTVEEYTTPCSVLTCTKSGSAYRNCDGSALDNTSPNLGLNCSLSYTDDTTGTPHSDCDDRWHTSRSLSFSASPPECGDSNSQTDISDDSGTPFACCGCVPDSVDTVIESDSRTTTSGSCSGGDSDCCGCDDCVCNADRFASTCSRSWSCSLQTVVELENEYTTNQLKTDALAALPAYATCFACDTSGADGCSALIAGQGCICSAFRNLSTGETSYTVRRFKYKFRFTASVTCRLKIFWHETFKPTLSAAVDFCGTHYNAGVEDPNPAHWTKIAKSYTASFGGNPCGPNIGPPTNPNGIVTEKDSTEFVCMEPSSNGTVYITDVRWSILDGVNGTDSYTPNPINYSNPCAPIAAGPNCIPDTS